MLDSQVASISWCSGEVRPSRWASVNAELMGQHRYAGRRTSRGDRGERKETSRSGEEGDGSGRGPGPACRGRRRLGARHRTGFSATANARSEDSVQKRAGSNPWSAAASCWRSLPLVASNDTVLARLLLRRDAVVVMASRDVSSSKLCWSCLAS